MEDIILSERSQLQIKTRKTAECFHLHGAPRGVTFIETEGRIVVTKGWREEEMGSWYLMGIEFQFCKVKKVLEMERGNSCPTV